MSTENLDPVPPLHFAVPPGRTLPFDIEKELENRCEVPLVAYAALQDLPETEESGVPELTALDSDLVMRNSRSSVQPSAISELGAYRDISRY